MSSEMAGKWATFARDVGNTQSLQLPNLIGYLFENGRLPTCSLPTTTLAGAQGRLRALRAPRYYRAPPFHLLFLLDDLDNCESISATRFIY